MANGQGGARIGAGRKKKALADNIADGNPGKRKLTVLDFNDTAADLTGQDMPPPKAYLAAKQKNGKDLIAVEIYTETWQWLAERDCAHLIPKQILEQYAMAISRWIQCEECITEYGFLAKHPTTGNRTAKALGMKEVPCVIADELTEDQIKAFRLADNKVGELATWDMDLLPLELADIVMPMADFGFEVISEDEFGDSFTLDDGEKKPFQQISITVHDEQAKLILAAIKYVYDHKAVTETFTNENHNGNGLYEVVREWAVQKKLL